MPDTELEGLFGTEEAKAAYNRTCEWIFNEPEPGYTPPLVDKSKAVTACMELENLIQDPMIDQAFKSLPPALFDARILTRFPDLTQSLWSLGNQINAQAVMESHTRVPQAILDEADGLRDRLFEMVKYHFGNEPAIAQLLTELRRNVGYMDLAKDLERLAGVVEDRKEDLVHDKRHYDENCASDARRLAREILKSLNATDTDKIKRAHLYQRIWKFTAFYYAEIYQTGRWAFRNSPVAERFVTMASIVRKSSRKSKPANSGDESPNKA